MFFEGPKDMSDNFSDKNDTLLIIFSAWHRNLRAGIKFWPVFNSSNIKHNRTVPLPKICLKFVTINVNRFKMIVKLKYVIFFGNID